MRSRLQGFHPETELRQVITEVSDLFHRGPNLERRLLMALNANVQKLIDDVARNADLSKSILAAQDLQNKQIADLKSQLASIQPGQPVNDENLAAINATVATIEQTNAALATAVPQGTVLAPNPIPLGDSGGQPLTKGTQPVTSDSAGNPIAPDAPGQPGVATSSPAVTPAPKFKSGPTDPNSPSNPTTDAVKSTFTPDPGTPTGPGNTPSTDPSKSS